MKKDDMLFVYGTLRPGERADLAKSRMEFDVDHLGLDAINGKLFHLGAYPGLKLIGKAGEDYNPRFPSVVGNVFILKNNSVSTILDGYESYRPDDPEHGLYNRFQVFTKIGRVVWVYTYNHPVTEDQLIETGDWRNPRLATTRKAPTYGMRRNG